MVAQLVAPGPAVCCFTPGVQPSHPREELAELKTRGELRYTISELALYSRLTHELKVCPIGCCTHAFPTMDNGCFRGRQI